MAHFHEHMLFLGTAKYPDENAYEDYLAKHGGSSNAYTALEDTNYFFNVNAPALLGEGGRDGALERFAQFFVEGGPKFAVDSLDREMLAVDSEHRMALLDDGKHTAAKWQKV